MGLDARHVYRVVLDEESNELLVVRGDVAGGNYEVLGPLSQLMRDRRGNEVLVTENGELRIRSGDVPEWYGLPIYMVDAAAEADDSYYILGVTHKRCTFCSLYVETNDAIVSFDGGTTDQFFLDVDAGQVILPGLDLPAGTSIAGKNAVVAADYTNLRIAVW